MRMRVVSTLVLLTMTGCLYADEPNYQDEQEWIGSVDASLSASERRVRAGQIRDAAAANGMTQGYLLAGIADAETRMSHCWSELTWACKGPDSADCGGGPVVAGAGDGPCYLREGGLGMFQFDAGTFDDTLRREGDRILSIAGNVAAAVDFVVNMVIRSAYVSGVDTRAQAIEWMNGVRVDNGRFDPWIRTVTHYYNGCRPSYSCWSSRYAHYRDNTTGVHSEMGAAFWDTRHDFHAEYADQTFPFARDPFELAPREEVSGYIELRNAGEATWRPGETFLGTTEPRDGASPIAGSDWINDHRPATVDRVVAPGETGRFEFSVRAPDVPGDYPQYFTLVQEGVAWFSEQGGPPDDQLQIRVTATEAPACPEGTGPEWTCEGTDLVRCEVGMTERTACEHGCEGAEGDDICSGPAVDADGDGHDARFDCDDTDPDINPGAHDVCGDGIDQNCDDMDAVCLDHDSGPGGRPISDDAHVSGGCSVGDAAVPPPGALTWMLALPVLLLSARRRRRP